MGRTHIVVIDTTTLMAQCSFCHWKSTEEMFMYHPECPVRINHDAPYPYLLEGHACLVGKFIQNKAIIVLIDLNNSCRIVRIAKV